MTKEKIARINQLAKKAKTTPLTPEELAERDILRKEYIASVTASLTSQLDVTYFVDEKGNKEKLKRNDEPSD
ncbi:MAG: DUF896 domain-containing protein [Eubacteriales bacterium]